MDNLVSLKELRLKLTQYTKAVEQEKKSFIVLRKSKPVFKIVPITDEEDGWETLIDFTKINPEGVPAEDVLKALEELARE